MLLLYIISSLSSSNNFHIFSGYKILAALFPFYSEDFSNYKEIIFQTYIKNLENSDLEVRAIEIHCFTVLISVINLPETMYFAQLLQPILKSIIYLLSNPGSYGEESLRSLCELADTEPMYFKSGLL